ncbi:hypothetical protein [Photobacterium angustum]|uniref:hypothetical protein n=1 Tax=Photobacterium angustum TaxID=661 RepID=UPI0005E594E1|nr:hypothetical protein [Photobacterium angustum]KJG00108.1 hypothetical protein UB35_19860 [Photobacterium angustum]PSV61667.1 hypothetical protein CTM95_20410 [Photobacterium angustum]
MSNVTWTLSVPTVDIERELYLGNFIAIRRSGYYNGNKISWQVARVLWIVGEFPAHANFESDFATRVIETLDIQFPSRNSKYGYGTRSRTGCYSYVELEDYGHMSKIEAKRLLSKLYAEDNYQTVSYECAGMNIDRAIKHVTQTFELTHPKKNNDE